MLVETRCKTESIQFKYKILSELQNWHVGFFFFPPFILETVYPESKKLPSLERTILDHFLKKKISAGKHIWVTATGKERMNYGFFLRTKQNHCLPAQLLCRRGVVLDPCVRGMFLNQLVLTFLYWSQEKRWENFKDKAKQTLLNSTVHVQAFFALLMLTHTTQCSSSVNILSFA